MGGPEMAPQPPHRSERPGKAEPLLGIACSSVVAVVKDLFFVARIRETARLAGIPLTFARTPDEITAAIAGPPRFVLLDLTAGFDYEAIFGAAEAARVPVLGFTTHALARQTQLWHQRCERVVTKETLSAELPTLLREGVTT